MMCGSLIMVAALIGLNACTEHYRWIAPRPDITHARMAADSQACKNAERQPTAYTNCMRAKGYRQANHEEVGPAGALVYQWVDLRRDKAKTYDDLAACQASAPRKPLRAPCRLKPA